MRSRDLVAAFRDLFVSSKNFFVNLEDLVIIFIPTNEININRRLLFPINRSLGFGGRDFCLITRLFAWLALPLTLSCNPTARKTRLNGPIDCEVTGADGLPGGHAQGSWCRSS